MATKKKTVQNDEVRSSEMTEAEYKRLADELNNLKTVERTNIAEKIRIARGHGDLSENSEYDEAKNEQARIEARILTLEEHLKDVKIVEAKSDKVSVGTKVTLLDMEFNEKNDYSISSTESGNDDNVITSDSAVGKAIIGHKVGDVVEVFAPGGTYKMKIIKISV